MVFHDDSRQETQFLLKTNPIKSGIQEDFALQEIWKQLMSYDVKWSK